MNGPQQSPLGPRPPLSSYGAPNPQPITVRVMRLSKPILPITSPKLPLPVGESSLDSPVQPPGSIYGYDLAVPSVFGRVAAGEKLCFLISLVNTSPADVSMIKVRVDLQKKATPNAPSFQLLETLIDTSATPIPLMLSGHRLEFACSTTVKDAATHSLACTVTYDKNPASPTPGATPQVTEAKPVATSYSKHFNFNVANDLIITTRTVSLFPEAGHTWLVEAKIECVVPLHMTSVNLYPDKSRPDIQVESVAATADSIAADPSPEASSAAALAGAKWNLDSFPAHLPRVRNVKGLTTERSVLHKTFRVTLNGDGTTLPNPFGVLHVDWRSVNCERGHLEQEVGYKPASDMKGIDLSVEKEKDTVELYESFNVTCTITNRRPTDMSLLIAYSDTRELTPAAVTSLTAAMQFSQKTANSSSKSESGGLSLSLSPTGIAPPVFSTQVSKTAQQSQPQPVQMTVSQPCGMIINGTTCDPDPVVIPAGTQYKHILSLLPVQLGLCSLGSLLFYDTITGTVVPCSDIGTVFVTSP